MGPTFVGVTAPLAREEGVTPSVWLPSCTAGGPQRGRGRLAVAPEADQPCRRLARLPRLRSIQVRLATHDDAEAIRPIYNPEVTTSTATFDLVPRSLEEQ